jgi:hypothetical protein
LHIFSQIKSAFGPLSTSGPILSASLSHFQPNNRYAHEVSDALKLQMVVGLQCSRLYTVMPPTLRSYINTDITKTWRTEAEKYHGVENFCL